MKKFFFSFYILIFLISCSDDDDIKIPDCLNSTTKAILGSPVQSPRASIEKWIYKGQEVYLIDAQNFPDGEIFIITIDCEETICTLGGIDGSDNDCPNWENAEFIETIWKDPR